MDCPPDKNTDSFISVLMTLVDPLNEDPLSGERLEKVIRELKESGRCQRELRLLKLRWGGESLLSFKEIGEVMAEDEEGREGPYQRETIRQAEAKAQKVLGYHYRHYTRYGRLPPSK